MSHVSPHGPISLPLEVMPGSPENIPLGECALSQSQDRLTPPSHAASTVFSLSRSESLWTPEPPPKRCDVFWFPIHFMSTGGSFLACGVIISGLCFASQCQPAPALLGPALLSIGLMVLVVGVVLIPITKKNRKRSHMRRPLGYYKPPAVDV
ncbi:phosphoinositide-interacting protein [Xiphophorus hellerii]|uniref:phosphoinositide-interacting protein n=1 Tax=Xiphophorus hellerii TaxID=8084 RepID=UPI0013B3A6CB|nr:phosphoinositide-interacting protein [Xiphophorus hellerii]